MEQILKSLKKILDCLRDNFSYSVEYRNVELIFNYIASNESNSLLSSTINILIGRLIRLRRLLSKDDPSYTNLTQLINQVRSKRIMAEVDLEDKGMDLDELKEFEENQPFKIRLSQHRPTPKKNKYAPSLFTIPEQDICFYAPGSNVTGDLRLIGVIAMLSKYSVTLYHDGGEKGLKKWILQYLSDCGVILKEIYNIKLSKDKNKKLLREMRNNTKPSWYSFHNDVSKDLKEDPEEYTSYDVTDLHNMMINRDKYFNEIHSLLPLKEGMDISKSIPVIRQYMNIHSGLHNNSGRKALVICLKDKAYDKFQYHQEHQISASIAIKVLELLTLYIKNNRLPPLDVYFKNDNGVRKKIYAMNDPHPNFMTINYLDDIDGYTRKTLFEQYKWLAINLPVDTVHYGGRSGHLEVMPFIGHKVIYYEEFYNPESGRIYDSLCSMHKSGKKIFVRYLDMQQTKGGALKLRSNDKSHSDHELGISSRINNSNSVKKIIADNLFQDLLYFIYGE